MFEKRLPIQTNGPKSWIAISGATGGLGKAFAIECASRGWDVFLTDLNAGPLEILGASLRSTYAVSVLTQTCDLADAEARADLFERIRTQNLRFWGLVNVAGTDSEGLFYEQTRQQIRSIIRLNVEGTLEMTHALLEFRDPLTPFRIINVASLAAFCPMPAKATYAASKRFLVDFSLALREEVRRLGATVTVLCPAGLPTNRDCVEAIEAQGWIGQVTTQNIGDVANQTIEAALAGRALVIPGLVNRTIQAVGALIPGSLAIRLIGGRWKSARAKRSIQVPRVSASAD
jgi:hypothetical protein